jgi:hypothetical protein
MFALTGRVKGEEGAREVGSKPLTKRPLPGMFMRCRAAVSGDRGVASPKEKRGKDDRIGVWIVSWMLLLVYQSSVMFETITAHY